MIIVDNYSWSTNINMVNDHEFHLSWPWPQWPQSSRQICTTSFFGGFHRYQRGAHLLHPVLGILDWKISMNNRGSELGTLEMLELSLNTLIYIYICLQKTYMYITIYIYIYEIIPTVNTCPHSVLHPRPFALQHCFAKPSDAEKWKTAPLMRGVVQSVPHRS